MTSRLLLHEELVSILQSRNVYYQPPESIKIVYPAIIYSRSDIDNTFADNVVYKQSNSYKVIVVDHNPDSPIVERMSKFKSTKYVSGYKANGINHDVFSVVY